MGDEMSRSIITKAQLTGGRGVLYFFAEDVACVAVSEKALHVFIDGAGSHAIEPIPDFVAKWAHVQAFGTLPDDDNDEYTDEPDIYNPGPRFGADDFSF